MAILSSVRWRGVELNDGVHFLLDTREATLDDPNPAEGTYATRKGATPVLLGTVLRESTIVLNINIIAGNAAELDAKILQLRRIFNPADLAEYSLERRLPHEQYHRYIVAGTRTVSFNRQLRRCSVTLQTADKTWQDTESAEVTATLFDEDSFTEDVVIAYAGNAPVEPVLEVTPLTVGNDGPTPLYYRDTELWYWAPIRVIGYPIKLVVNWDVSTLVADEKMQPDYSDISVTWNGHTLPHNIVERDENELDIWVIPTYAPMVADHMTLGLRSGTLSQAQLLSTDGAGVKFRLNSGSTSPTPPTAAVIRINGEYLSYSGLKLLSSGANGGAPTYEATVVARGLHGTVAANHYTGQPVMYPSTLRVSYGYAPGYEKTFPRRWGNGWPDIDYVESGNSEWKYTTDYTQQRGSGATASGFSWFTTPATQERPRELLYGISPSDPTYGPYAGLVSTYPNAVNASSVARLALAHPGSGSTQRRMSAIRVVFELMGGPNSASPGFDVYLRKVRSGFAIGKTAAGAIENTKDLWHHRHTTTSTVEVDTDYIFTDSWFDWFSHFVIEIPNAPPGSSSRRILRIKSFYIRWDGAGSAPDYVHYPSTIGLGTEAGIGTGEFPVFFSMRNLSDTAQTAPFSIAARMAEDTTGTIDCQARTVTGALQLPEVDYKKSTWLRLLPGNNTVRFAAGTGSGHVRVRLVWRNRY